MNIEQDNRNAAEGGKGEGDYTSIITDHRDEEAAQGGAGKGVRAPDEQHQERGGEQRTIESVSGEVAGILTGRRRWGRVARLPLEVRNWLNEQLRDGRKCKEIVAALAEKGFGGFTRHDLVKWKRGGFVDWVRERERVGALQADLGRVFNALGEIDEEKTEGFGRFNELLIAMQILHALQDLHRGTLKSLVEKKPELLFRVAKVASDQARDRARRKRTSLMVRKYEDRVATKEVAEPEGEPGLSPETLVEIERALAKIL